MGDKAHTTNEFARTLMFYHLYQREKLNAVDLAKISKKYAKKPTALIEDLSRKYSYWEIPPSVTWDCLVRLISLYELPQAYSSLLQGIPGVAHIKYDPKLDIYSAKFDAEAVLQRNGGPLLACGHKVVRFDNLSKVSHLVPGFSGTAPRFEIAPVPVSTRAASAPLTTFASIAEVSLRKNNFVDKMGRQQSQDSPLALLRKFMSRKQRVRVMLRRRGG